MSDIHGTSIPKLKHKNDNITNIVNVDNLRKTRLNLMICFKAQRDGYQGYPMYGNRSPHQVAKMEILSLPGLCVRYRYRQYHQHQINMIGCLVVPK